MFKNKFYLLIVSLLMAVSIVGCTTVKAAPQADAQTVPSSNLPRTITVVGSGKIFLTPDVGKITVGAEAIAPTVSEAKAQVDAQIDAIMAALKAFGIEDKDIQTSNYSIYFERESVPVVMREGTEMAEPQGGYRVSNTLEVTVRNIDAVGDVLDAVVEAGANQVYGVYFTVSDNALWEGQAREKAMVDAKARALELARLSEVELGKVISVSEVIGSSGNYYPVMAERAYGGGGAGIAPGELELGTQVQVVFEIK
ncbi:MAG: SIMPL domain-containing protein [Anaerolineae bacterium]|nr:SIMPL domain-containing protein [Anaerolineae bacterium]